jgi:uncharacterized repeat protein (TIGR03803 family)
MLVCSLIVLVAATYTSHAQTFTVLHDFNTSDPQPAGALAQGEDGKFYGVSGLNTMFTFDPVSGDTAQQPISLTGFGLTAGLVMGNAGTFYGTTELGGLNDFGTIFYLRSDGTLITLYNFDGYNGGVPFGSLIQGVDGELYGTTSEGAAGGCRRGCGTVFRLNIYREIYTVLHRFYRRIGDGAFPDAGLLQATDGNFYGTTAEGGTNNEGTVFSMNSKGDLTILYSFNRTDGEAPEASLVEGPDGYLYGTTTSGGVDRDGTIFKVSRSGQLTTLHTFTYTDGEDPNSALILASDGKFYGLTRFGGTGTCSRGFGCGTLFSIDTAGNFQKLHDFGFDDGTYPAAGLLQATNGVFYGIATNGGLADCNNGEGCGTLYSFDMGLRPFITFPHAAGKVGTSGPILGQGFTGTTSVAINGTKVPFTVISDAHIQATIAPGATTGYVTVTTPSGVLTSNVPFHVLP